MKKLRNKVFWTIYGIVLGIAFIIVLVYNVSNYFNTRAMLMDAFMSPFVDQRYSSFIVQGFVNNLSSSIILFLIIAIAFYFISKIITDWIVRPAEEAFSKQKDFIADASHELKTPLSVIVASSDALEKDPKETKWIKNIQDEATRMNQLITKLLNLASTENQDKSNFKQANLSKTVELSALTFEGRAAEKDCKIKLNITENIIFNFDEDDIKQLVEILLDNAVKHSPNKEIIELELSKTNKQINLKVVNVGEGIAAGDEEKIFERFYRADKARDTKDNRYGLGLAIAKNIVQNHNGQISAKSINGKTEFNVNF